MKNIWLISAITFKEGIKGRVLHGIFFFAVILCGFDVVITNMFTRELGKVAVDVGLSTVSISGLAIIFFMSMNLLSKDLDKLTIYMILARAVSRSQYLIGKFLGLSSLIVLSVFILGSVVVLFVKLILVNYPEYVPALFSWPTFFMALFFSLLSLLVVFSLSVLFTCLTSSSYIALLLTGCSYFIGQNIELFRLILLKDEKSALKGVFKLISYVFPNLSAFDLKTVAAYGLPLNYSEMLITGLYGITYILVVLYISIVILNRRELT